MANLRIWIILSWIALPTVMFGGYSLLRLLNRGDVLTPFQVNSFRAGHAHAGVLLLLSLLYYIFLDRTSLSDSVKQGACALRYLWASWRNRGDFSFTCGSDSQTGPPLGQPSPSPGRRCSPAPSSCWSTA